MQGPAGPLCRINETEQTEGYYPAGVTSTSMYARGVTHWYVYDGLGSVIAELDDNNNVTTSGQYDVYGTPRPGTRQGGSPTSSQGYVGELGHVTDASTGGLIYMQARYYDPSLGRFVSEDPGCNGTNWYVYAEDSPTCNVDNNGRLSMQGGYKGLLLILALVWVAETAFGWKPTAQEQHLIHVAEGSATLIGLVKDACADIGLALGDCAAGEAGDPIEAAGWALAENGAAVAVAAATVEQIILYDLCEDDSGKPESE